MILQRIISAGYVPFVSTASFLEPSFDLQPFGIDVRVMGTGAEFNNFHKAYLLANTLAFGDPKGGLGMPGWVLTDYVLHQTAVVGFMAPREMCQPEFLAVFDRHPEMVDAQALEYVPISGQIAGLSADRETWFGSSLFSHQTFRPDKQQLDVKFRINDGLDVSLATYTKALALQVYGAKRFMGLTQYANAAVKNHGLFGRMYLHDPIVWTHDRPLDSFTYRMDVDFDIDRLCPSAAQHYDFLLNAGDDDAKHQLVQRIAGGETFEIVAPYQLRSAERIELPIVENPE